ncbi:TPA: 4'-phosphopantetheinyl transferase family protein [Providencia alcalifaciens]
MPEDIEQSIPKRQYEYIRGRICAADALSQLGCFQLDVGRGADKAPLWPAGIVGSISHNDNWAIACVAWEHEYSGLGIDIETRIEPSYLDAMNQYIYTQEEFKLMNLTVADRLTASTILFSIKESVIKLFLAQNLTLQSFTDIRLIQVRGTLIMLELFRGSVSTHKYLIGQYWVYDDNIITLVTEKVPRFKK